MRLTLRTLLAYRDGVLSPAETSDLHQRIKQSDFASNLLRRIENLVRHKQLLAPKIKGEGLGGDANSVAEYLDDALASEQVPEFERICIAESDLVLGELAHCHQLLAEALNSQVVVPPGLKALAVSLASPQNQAALARRLKIGGVKSSIDAGPAGSIRRLDNAHPEPLVTQAPTEQHSKVQAPMVASGGGSIKPQGLDLERPQLAHEVPEYLVGQRSGGWRIPLAIGAMIALLSVIAWQALGPLKNVQELFVASNDALSGAEKTPENNIVEPTSEVVDRTAANSESPANAEVVAKPANNSGDSSRDATVLESDSPKAAETLRDAPNSNTAGTDPTPPKADLTDNTFRWTPSSEDTNSVLFVRSTVDGTTSQKLVTANAPMPTDAEVVVPPSMRPTLNLANHCLWTVCGPTLMQLSQPENVTISTSLCRAITKAGAQGRDVTIATPTGSVKLQFEDATSMAAVEVASRPVSHGLLTDKLAFKPFLIIVAVEGQVSVTPTRESGDSKSVRLVVGEGVAFTGTEPIEFELGAIPNWYRSGNDRPVDSLAAADMHKFIQGNEDVAKQLTELCADRRPETAALAIQSKILMGDWSEFAGDFLNNEMMRSHWSSALGLAEQLIAAKEQNAETLRTAFETAHVGRGSALLALLVGPSDSAQPKETMLKLVESLGSSELDERVLAAHQLRRLTGKDMGFQPSFPNRSVLQQWRRAITSSPSLLSLDNPLWEAKKAAAER